MQRTVTVRTHVRSGIVLCARRSTGTQTIASLQGTLLDGARARAQLRMVVRAVRKARADEHARQRVMPDVVYFARQAVEFLASMGVRLRGLQRAGSVPELFPQVRSATAHQIGGADFWCLPQNVTVMGHWAGPAQWRERSPAERAAVHIAG